MDQQTDEWHELRRPCITASRTLEIIKLSKGYARQKRKEIDEGKVRRFSNDATRWGNRNEPKADALYRLKRDIDTEACGFVISVEFPYFGASCDRSVGIDGLTEIKCPYLQSNFEAFNFSIPDQYMAQMQGQLFVTGRKWCDFVGFDPRQKIENRLFVKRIYPEEEWIEKIRHAVPYFWEHYIVNDFDDMKIPQLF